MSQFETSPESQATYDALELAINNHFRQAWKDNEVLAAGDYIPQWALVIHYDDLNQAATSNGYDVESSKRLPPHALKGLLYEGIDWVTDRQSREDDD